MYSHFNIKVTNKGVMHEVGYVTLSGAPSTTSHLDILICPFHYSRSPLSYCTLMCDLIMNLYTCNAYIMFF